MSDNQLSHWSNLSSLTEKLLVTRANELHCPEFGNDDVPVTNLEHLLVSTFEQFLTNEYLFDFGHILITNNQ